MMIRMRIIYIISCSILLGFAIAVRLAEIYIGSDLAPPQPFLTENYCANNGPVSFRPKLGASIPNCLLPPGPAVGIGLIHINVFSPIGYRCPKKGYVCGYSLVPRDFNGNVKVRCCKAKLVSYKEKECVRYFRIESPSSPSPSPPGYYLVGANPFVLPGGSKCTNCVNVLADINVFSPIGYRCPKKRYVCGYSLVPQDFNGNVKVRFCKGKSDSITKSVHFDE